MVTPPPPPPPPSPPPAHGERFLTIPDAIISHGYAGRLLTRLRPIQMPLRARNATMLTPIERLNLGSYAAVDPQNVSLRVDATGALQLVALSTVDPDGCTVALCIRVHDASSAQPVVRQVTLSPPDTNAAKQFEAGTLMRRVVALDDHTAALVEYARLRFVRFDAGVTTPVVSEIRSVRHIARVGAQSVVVNCGEELLVVELQSDNSCRVHGLENPCGVSRVCASGERFCAQGDKYCTVWNARTRQIESSLTTPRLGIVEAIALGEKHQALLQSSVRYGVRIVVPNPRPPLFRKHLNGREYQNADWSDSCMLIVRDVLVCAFKSRSRFYFAAVPLTENGEGSMCVPYATAFNSLQGSITPQFAVMPDGTLFTVVGEDEHIMLARYRLPPPIDTLLGSTSVLSAAMFTPIERVNLASHALDPHHVSLRVDTAGELQLVALSTAHADGRTEALCIRVHDASDAQPDVRQVKLSPPDANAVNQFETGTLMRCVVALDNHTAALVEYARLSFVRFDAGVTTPVVSAIRGIRHIARVGAQSVVVYCGEELSVVELQSDDSCRVHGFDQPIGVNQLCANGERFFTQGDKYCTVWNARTRQIEKSLKTPTDSVVESIALGDKHRALLRRRARFGVQIVVPTLPPWAFKRRLGEHGDADWCDSFMRIARDVLVCAVKSRGRFYFVAAHLAENGANSMCWVPYAAALNSSHGSISPQFAIMRDGTLFALIADKEDILLARYRLPAPFDTLPSSATEVPQSRDLAVGTESAHAT